MCGQTYMQAVRQIGVRTDIHTCSEAGRQAGRNRRTDILAYALLRLIYTHLRIKLVCFKEKIFYIFKTH